VTPTPGPTSPQAPSAPTKLKVRVKKRKASTSWATVPAATEYKVRVSKVKGKKGAGKRTTKTSFTTGKLKKGKYMVEVRAVGTGGGGPVAKKGFKVT